MTQPELKQFDDLTPGDFERHSVWIGCHTVDTDELWYENTDEETFRPWTGSLPVDPAEGMLLVRATIELRDGSRYPGFVTPAFEADDLGTQQPHFYVEGKRFGVWGGMFGISVENRKALYEALGKSADAVFPLRFSADPAVARGVASGTAAGFYRSSRDGLSVER